MLFRCKMILMIVGLSACLSLNLSGQKQAFFSGDSIKFSGELNSVFFNLADRDKKIIAPYIETFMQKWDKGKFSDAHKKIIYEILNEMMQKKIKPFPDFLNYINTLNIFINTNQPDGYFIPWSDILKKLLDEKSNRNFLLFIESTSNLFAENLVYKSATTQWKINTVAYHFSFDSVPSIEFSTCNLVCYANDDSLNIDATRGVYYPFTNLWQGEHGLVNWKRAGEDPQKTFATLSRYSIQMRFSKFTADSVMFTNKKYFPSPIIGTYTDKVLASATVENASFPTFNSYDKMIGISHLFSKIDYLGGFAMEGNRVIGTGDKSMDARLFFKMNGKDVVIVKSKLFLIRSDRINSGMASVTIYHENDSIYHPGLQLKYMDNNKELSFNRDERITTISPWFDSFHKIELYCEALYWNVGQPKISFEIMKGPTKESKAVFESSSYYSMPRYEKLQGIDLVNPLVRIKSYTDQKKSKEFTLNQIAYFMNSSVEQVEDQLLKMANRGFLLYDNEKKIARVKNKLFDYINAYNGMADYDIIFFNSVVTNKSNAILNLETFDLKIQGVKSIALSDAQKVIVYPTNDEVVLKKDMDFVFSGRLEAGLFDFHAFDCSFEYKKFKINLPSIDSMFYYVNSKIWDPKTESFLKVRTKTAITNLSGTLLIDDPESKSGRKNLKQYPIFTNRNNAMVYYNDSSILKGVYAKDKFFYEVKPFSISSLDDMETDSLKFTGSLATGGIFPQIDEPLKIRPDYSLGVETTTDSAGLPVYGGKGTFIAKVDMSNRGLHGNGTFRYLNSTSYSPDYTFLPDSMMALAKTFKTVEVAGAVEYPETHGDSVKEFWLPYKDSLLINSPTKDLAMYNNQSSFRGKLALTPRMLSGNGNVKIRDATMVSREFKFNRRTFDALIADFRIQAYLADLTISTKNYQTHFDFDNRKGEFKSNVGISQVQFPINKYECSMDRFDWLIDSEEILLTNEMSKMRAYDTLSLAQLIDVAYTGSEFISVKDTLHEPLKFFASKARYNLRTNVINAQDVKIIKVADAAVFPDSGKVMIYKDAQMQTLVHAIIIANTTSRFHQFYNAEVSIATRKDYTGKGDYDYIDRTGQRETIHFGDIRVDSAIHTTAQGLIKDSANFRLSPEFAFNGNAILHAGEKNLTFDGGFYPITTCFNVKEERVRFMGQIDPNHVQIPVNAPLKNTAYEPINLGLMFLNTEVRIGPSFFRRKIGYSDTTMITANGFIEYNIPTGEFRVAKPEKLLNLGEKGNYFSLNTENCMIRGEGQLNLSLRSGNFNMENFGTLDYYIIPDSVRLHCAIALNFPFPEQGLLRFSSQVEAVNLPGVKLMSTPYAMAIGNMLDKPEFDRLTGEQELLGKYKKFPVALERSLFLADVSMKWDSSSHSYISYGAIGIANIGKSQVNRYVNGIIQFTKKNNGDDFTIYLELTKNDWFYFNYRNNMLMALSSDLNFNDIVREATQSKSELKKISNVARGYVCRPATQRMKSDFLSKFETEDTP